MTRYLLLASAILLAAPGLQAAASLDGLRWFQIEVSVFSNDYPEYRDAERWSPRQLDLRYPPRTRPFATLGDFFAARAFAARNPASGSDTELDQPPPVGPFPRTNPGRLRLPDPEREPFLLLPPTASDFQTTNTRLERSADHRLLFHGIWRQPVVQTESAYPLQVVGGQRVGGHFELEGTLRIRFNEGEDRVVIDANLWLAEFGAAEDGLPWVLPPLPGTPAGTGAEQGLAGIRRIVQLLESRPMRSNEFHYLDHPALGIVVTVKPYDLPPPVELSMETPRAENLPPR